MYFLFSEEVMGYQIASRKRNFDGLLTSGDDCTRIFAQSTLRHHFLLLKRWLAQLYSVLPSESSTLDSFDMLCG